MDTADGASPPPLANIRVARADAGDVSEGELAPAERMGLYVHFPFCSVHCPYCDFAVDARAEIPHEEYADAVVAEIAARAPWFQRSDSSTSPRLVSIYFGGGTPGLWRTDALARVLRAGQAHLGQATVGGAAGNDWVGPLEITVEANPGEVSATKLGELRQVGVNRLSLGVQSLDDGMLGAIGRNHDAAAGTRAVREARAAGFENVSIDLMFGLPGQSFDTWRRSVDAVLALHPEHVSAYALTIERGTVFGARARKGELVVPDDDTAAAMQEWARDALGSAGLQQYEVSSYARPGRRAVHNALYWTGAPYLGVGASAASFRPLVGGAGWRFSNPRATETYLRSHRPAPSSPAPTSPAPTSPAPTKVDKREPEDMENEAVWLALRTSDGVDRAAHAGRYGEDPVPKRQVEITRCIERGWLILDEGTLRPTPAGLLFADEIATRLWLQPPASREKPHQG